MAPGAPPGPLDPPNCAPAWVDTLQPDPAAAAEFYAGLFGWEFPEDPEEPGIHGPASGYRVARLRGHRVAGIAQSPPGAPAGWRTCIRVADLAQATAAVEAGGGSLLGEPQTVGTDGRVAMVTDATGVPLGLWEASGLPGAELVDEPGTWQMSSLHTPDLEASQTFYGAVFGWVVDELADAPYARWLLGGKAVAVVTPTGGTGVPPHWSVNFSVADVDAVAERAAALGGSALMAPFHTPGFRNAVLSDPGGGVFAVSHHAATGV